MLSISNLVYSIGSKVIYDDASLFISNSDKLALVGLNGAGKSTLLKIITSEINPEKIKINKDNDCTIGFLNQDQLSYQSQESILKVAMEAFSDILKLQKQMDQILHQMETNYTEELLEKLSSIQEKFTNMGGYEIESKSEKVLEGIGFTTDQLHKPLKEFSGGWRMRVILAKLLLENPSLLLLDEPTNHLDIVSIQWLEGYLKNYPGAFIVISHDKRFLNNCVDKTIEVANHKLNVYAGNYSFYEKEKLKQEEIQNNAYQNQQKMIKHTEKFISRFRAKASKASQVQSRIKSLNKIDRIEAVSSSAPKVNLKFQIDKNPGRDIVILDKISLSYPNPANNEKLKIFQDTSAKIEKGDKIALIGSNGKGKTSLLKLIAKTQNTDSGQINYGHNVQLSFYDQHQMESLNLNNSIYDEMRVYFPEISEADLRGTLGALLFRKDEVLKKISVLSGGEKARVALAKVILSGSNFIILDEPTNHLDMISIEILSNALINYHGTLILVSHNRDFIEKIANKIWFIENHKIKEFPDNYRAYEYWLKETKYQ